MSTNDDNWNYHEVRNYFIRNGKHVHTKHPRNSFDLEMLPIEKEMEQIYSMCSGACSTKESLFEYLENECPNQIFAKRAISRINDGFDFTSNYPL